MNEQSYFHWDLFRPQLHSPSFAMGTSFLDIREEAMRGVPGKPKSFSFDQSCALWSKDLGLDHTDGLTNVGGRVLEIRKEKSRDAARSRRGKENYEFYELAKLLPLPAAITSQLDKASIIRLTISYLKLRDFCGHGDPPWSRDGQNLNKNLKGAQRRNSELSADLFDLHQGAHILQSLDGFAFALSNDGRFLYISETVSIYLGLSQVEMAGSSIFDYVHSQDHQELADQLGLSLASVSGTLSSPNSPTVDSPIASRAITPPLNDRMPVMSPNLEKSCSRSFCIRMKSTLTKRGVHSRSSGYRVVFMVGRFRSQINYNVGRKCPGPLMGMSGVAIALPPPTITELRIEADTFIMRLTAQFRIIYCENVISTVTDWKCEDVIGRDLYEFSHPADAHLVKKLHKDLLQKGQVVCPSTRLLNKGGGFIWVSICCTSLYSSKTSDDQTVLAIVQTISNIEHRGVAMDASQLPQSASPEATHTPKDADLLEECLPASPASTRSVHSQKSTGNSPETAEPESATTPESSSVFPSEIDNDFLLDENIEHETETVKFDNKFSRRKTDRPRKRKRESEEKGLFCYSGDPDKTRESLTPSEDRTSRVSGLSVCPDQTSFPDSPDTVSTPQPLQLAPEDLSVKPDGQKSLFSKRDSDKDSGSSIMKSAVISSSVQELEKAMNRHLPAGKHDTVHDTFTAQKSGVHIPRSMSPDSHAFSSPFQMGNIFTCRESVIRSGVRPKEINGDPSVLNMPGYQSGEVTIPRDQIHLHIPYISVNTKHLSHTSKDHVSRVEELTMTTSSAELVPDRLSSPYHEPQSLRDCMGIRHSRVIANKDFEIAQDSNTELSKARSLQQPNYQFHSDFGNFPYDTMQTSGILYDPRSSASSAVWYSQDYHP